MDQPQTPTIDSEDKRIEASLRRQRMRELYSSWQDQKANNPQLTAKKTDRMGFGFFGVMLVICVAGDALDGVTGGTLGWLVGFVIDLILLIGAGISKGGRKQFKKILIAVLGESIPFVSALPIRSIMLIWSYVASHSQTAAKVSQATTLLSLRGNSKRNQELLGKYRLSESRASSLRNAADIATGTPDYIQ